MNTLKNAEKMTHSRIPLILQDQVENILWQFLEYIDKLGITRRVEITEF